MSTESKANETRTGDERGRPPIPSLELRRRLAIRVDPTYDRGSIEAPFRPDTAYAELKRVSTGTTPNTTFAAVRELMGLWAKQDLAGDLGGYEPLATWIKPGMRVAVKPNLVLHTHPAGDVGLRATVTDAAVVRVVLDYVAQAMHGNGTITIAESPIRMTDFGEVVRWTGLDRVLDDVSSTWGVDVELIDIRDQTTRDASTFSHTLDVRHQPGDPRGALNVNLGRYSALEALGDSMVRLRSTAAVGKNEARATHLAGRHQYAISRSVLDADAIISMPKLKTHKKAGMTCALKNFVGANLRKEWLPHHRRGSPSVGGDEFAEDTSRRFKIREQAKDLHMQTSMGRWLMRPLLWAYRNTLKDTRIDIFRRTPLAAMINGGWSGNDTCWRMVHDIFRAVMYGIDQGIDCRAPRRVPLTIVDGLIAGEGDGPLKPSSRRAGILMMGFDAPWVDFFATLLMGFDPQKIAMIRKAVRLDVEAPLTLLDACDVDLRCQPQELATLLSRHEPSSQPFMPPLGWARELVGEQAYVEALRAQAGASMDY